MFKFLNLEPEVFAIDINDLSIKIAKIRKKGKGFVLVSFNETEIKPGVIEDGAIRDEEELIKTIKSACGSVKGERLNTKYVIASLPEEKSFVQTLQMPKMTDEELKSALPFEIENYIPLSIDKVYWDFQTIKATSNTSGKCSLLVNVMPKTIVNSYVFCLKKAGLVPCALEVESQAIVRALAVAEKDIAPRIIVDIGKNSSILIISAGDSIRFTCSIPISSDNLTKAISDELAVDEWMAEEIKIKYGLSGDFGGAKLSSEEAKKAKIVSEAIKPILREFATQIKKYVDFYLSHASESDIATGKIEEIILCGGGSSLKNLPDFFWDELKIKTRIGNSMAGIVLKKIYEKEFASQKALSFAAAVGLAIRGANNKIYDL